MLGTIKTLLSTKTEDVKAAKPSVQLTKLEPGSGIQFSSESAIPELRGKKAIVQLVRTYRFGETATVSYLLSVDSVESLMLTIAEDEEGYYLGISRELSPDQQHLWFDRDALGFFIEPSSAKTLKAKVTDAQFPGWVAPKYVKAIDHMEGALTQGRLSTSDSARKTQSIRYSLLVSDAGDRAVEIEIYPELRMHRVYATVYRPADDIVQVSRPIPHIPVPEPRPRTEIKTIDVDSEPVAITVPVKTIPKTNGTHAPAPVVEQQPPVEAFRRPDFRRLNTSEPVQVARPAAPVRVIDEDPADVPPVPDFLTSEKKTLTRSKYLTLDEVLPPEIERVRCDIVTAKLLIDASVKRGVRVRDLLRVMTGLQTPAHDEVLFEMPLSDEDYRQLAQRYQLKPDMRAEIRNRMMDELQKKLKKMNG